MAMTFTFNDETGAIVQQLVQAAQREGWDAAMRCAQHNNEHPIIKGSLEVAGATAVGAAAGIGLAWLFSRN